MMPMNNKSPFPNLLALFAFPPILSSFIIGSIIDLLVDDINKRLADKELVVALSDSAKQFIVDNGYDPVYGARPLKRYLQKNVETLAARLILLSLK